MTLKLYEHQNIGLPKLKNMERKGKGGFLADGMGLVKTITMATHLMRNKLPGKKDLIVCPLSLMKQWRREIERVYKASNATKPRILYFHGTKRMEKLGKKKWDFIITTYSVIGAGQLNRKNGEGLFLMNLILLKMVFKLINLNARWQHLKLVREVNITGVLLVLLSITV